MTLATVRHKSGITGMVHDCISSHCMASRDSIA
jgi:hypothetical protein